jgi:TctA family transporter
MIMTGCGFAGNIMKRVDIQVGPLVMAMILGSIVEKNLITACEFE